MTERERKIAVLLTSILQGNLTVAGLRRTPGRKTRPRSR